MSPACEKSDVKKKSQKTSTLVIDLNLRKKRSFFDRGVFFRGGGKKGGLQAWGGDQNSIGKREKEGGEQSALGGRVKPER